MKIPKLLLSCVVAYAILLVLIRGLFPPQSSATLSLVGVPLLIIAAIIARDLARRSTGPTISPRNLASSRITEDPVKFLSGQIRVASGATDSYFEKIVRTRLRELMITKVALEKGSDRDMVRRLLSDPNNGPKLLGNNELYALLYGPLPSTRIRTEMINKAVEMIGAWKG